jgi:uncharacterized protein (DUF1810 family)
MTADPFTLERFVDAQGDQFDSVCRELEAGRKSSHWMWYVFPQLRGLGRSPMAHTFAISGAAEARAYLEHPLLGPRLRQSTELVNQVQDRTLRQIFGTPDDLKFRSCMTLFAQVAPDAGVFQMALKKYCGGEGDPATLKLLEAPSD